MARGRDVWVSLCWSEAQTTQHHGCWRHQEGINQNWLIPSSKWPLKRVPIELPGWEPGVHRNQEEIWLPLHRLESFWITPCPVTVKPLITSNAATKPFHWRKLFLSNVKGGGMHGPPLFLGITFKGRVSPPPDTIPGAGTTPGLQSKHVPKGRAGQGSPETSHSLCNISAAPPAPPSSQAAHACQMLHILEGGEERFRGQGHKQCLTPFFVKGPCRGRGSWEEIPACVCKKPSRVGFTVKFAHVWLRRGGKLQGMGVPRLK